MLFKKATNLFILITLCFIIFGTIGVQAYEWCTTPDPSGCKTRGSRCCTDITCGPPPTKEWHCGSYCTGKCAPPCSGCSGGCGDYCSGDNLISGRSCSCDSCTSGTTVSCTYGCFENACRNPDNDQALCESEGFLWMTGSGTAGKCCGDDPSNQLAVDNGRILQSAAAGQWLCTVDAGTPALRASNAYTGTIIDIPGENFDAVAGEAFWYMCDSNQDSDHGDLDHLYEFWDGCRTDGTCRYPGGGATCNGLVCGVIAASDVVEVPASTGTPASLLSDTDGTDGKWYNYFDSLYATSTESIGDASNPLSVPLTGLASGSEYTVYVALRNNGGGNNFYARLGSSGTYVQLGASYDPMTWVPVGTISGVTSTQVDLYYDGGAALTMIVQNVRAIKTGVRYETPSPAIIAGDRHYLCGTDLDLNGNTLTGERFIECCGEDNCVNTAQVAAVTETVTVGSDDWVCGSDNEWHDASNVNENPIVCEMMDPGNAWSGGTCCGNDPGEEFIWSWRGEEKGCCPNPNQQCLVDNEGSPINTNKPDTFYSTGKGPHCIQNNQFVLNHYCDEGVWRSRNKETADKLLNVVKDADADHYVIFCDDYHNALAYYDYLTHGNEPLEPAFLQNDSCQVGSREYPCYNTFCVASAPDIGLAVVGGSFNFPRSVPELEEIFGALGDCDSAKQDGDGKFHKCNDNLWLNNASRSFVYSQQNIQVEGGLFGWTDNMFTWLKSEFDPFFTWIGTNKYALADEIIEKADTYESFYVYSSTTKEVFARKEGVYTDAGYDALLAVDFTGFTSDICGQVDISFPGMCTEEGANTKYVSALESEGNNAALFEVWQEISAGLRVN